ncbi:MAG TPA: HypC/HybG/HupF family hydrogenase formation chaperone [Verrucomicrobiae bacterium]|nr:HypC/HybG/HupF family hydrogenase formation chaperone [Verrucomicrobiae bacterium]
MCLAIPAKVITVSENLAQVDLMGNHRSVNTNLVAEELKPGDWVLVHAGYAMEKIDEEIAQETLGLLEEALDKSEY